MFLLFKARQHWPECFGMTLQCWGVPSARSEGLNLSQLKAASDAQYVTGIDFCPEETEASQCSFRQSKASRRERIISQDTTPAFPWEGNQYIVFCVCIWHCTVS